MAEVRQIAIPSLVRIKPGAMDRIGIYMDRAQFKSPTLFVSDGLPEEIVQRVYESLNRAGIAGVRPVSIAEASVEEAIGLQSRVADATDVVLGLGGGKALDSAKYIADQLDKPYCAIPTSLSNDGFCSPQSSLTMEGQRKSIPVGMPYGVVVDTEICLAAPKILWLSGVGDLISKLTAVRDWKLAFHRRGTHVDDFAALLSDASVFQFIGRPQRDLEGVRLLSTALMLNGVSMSICGSSRPASGSEHLISHALDRISTRPRLHGLQVGMATLIVSKLYDEDFERIVQLFDEVGFWEPILKDPFSRREWLAAIRLAPSLKSDFYTILSECDQTDRLMAVINGLPCLRDCFVD